MDITRLQELLGHLKTLPSPDLPEPTLFSIGGRGYYENPTSDVLAFFCNSEGAHGLGSIVMKALFDALSKLEVETVNLPDDDFSLINEPEREVSTKDGSRIDLLLEGNEWVMVIENKIYHQQNNPFKSYQKYIQTNERYRDKPPIYVVLSPQGGSPEGWHSLSYPQLLHCLKEKLSQAFISQPLNKWLILLREFILHLDGIMSGPTTPKETMDFVLGNLTEIKQAQDLKQKVVTSLQQEVLNKLQNAYPDQTIGTKLHHWSGYPAIHFYFESWETDSKAVLFLDGRKENARCINYYACDIESQEQRNQADTLLKEDDCDTPWDESSNKIRCYKARFDKFDSAAAEQLLIHKLSLLNKLETQIRSQW